MITEHSNAFENNLPFSVSILNTCTHQMNWHSSLELIYVLNGSVHVTVNDKLTNVSQDEFLLINSYDTHELIHMDQNSLLIVLRFNPEFYSSYYPQINETRFEEQPLDVPETLQALNSLKAFIAKTLLNINETFETQQLRLLGLSVQLFENIIIAFKGETQASDSIAHGSRERLARIVQYIDLHSSEVLTLNDLARQEYVTPHYLSKYFKTHMGINFSTYLAQIRLHKSMPMLMGTSESILTIALVHGFSNAKSYSQAFKKLYGDTPHVFRMTFKNNSRQPLNTGIEINDSDQEKIHAYIKAHQLVETPVMTSKRIHKTIDLTRTMPQYVRFNKAIYFDFVYDGLNSNWQNNLTQTQKLLDFEYIKFKGILSSGLYFYNQDQNCYNWFNVDNLLDFFIEKNLKPFIELTYTPAEHTLNEWHELLENFLSHCLERYGREQLKTWNFEIASEDRRYESAIKLYTKTLKRIKTRFPDLRMGILFIPADDFEERDYLINFRNTDLRFMSVQISDETYNKKRALCHELFYNIRIGMGLETYVIFRHADNYWNDTCFMSTRVIQETLENSTIDLQLPFIDNIQSNLMFQGNDALLTYNGLQKPMFNSSFLLSKLRGKLIAKDREYFIVKNAEDTYSILVYNHTEEISEIMDTQTTSHVKYMQLKQRLELANEISVAFSFNIDEGSYEKRVYTLNSENGSIFDAWIRMGAPNTLIKDDMGILKAKEKMHLHISNVGLNKNMSLEIQLKPGEVKLIELRKM